MRLPVRFAWKKWRLRNQPVPYRGERRLSDREILQFEEAVCLLADKKKMQSVASADEAGALLARQVLSGDGGGQ